MTSTDHRPPLQPVNPRQHDDGMAWQRDRRRFAAFLTAKDLVLGYTRTATEGAGRLAARLHLDGLFMMVRCSYGWLLGAASVAARGLRAPGVLAGLVWGLTTDVGRPWSARPFTWSAQLSAPLLTESGRRSIGRCGCSAPFTRVPPATVRVVLAGSQLVVGRPVVLPWASRGQGALVASGVGTVSAPEGRCQYRSRAS